jgi:hypothetical protein
LAPWRKLVRKATIYGESVANEIVKVVIRNGLGEFYALLQWSFLARQAAKSHPAGAFMGRKKTAVWPQGLAAERISGHW